MKKQPSSRGSRRVSFQLGSILSTPGANRLGVDLNHYLDRHRQGDWGDVHEEDWATNDAALGGDDCLMSVYKTPNGELWIVTEADRSTTTFLLPEEY